MHAVFVSTPVLNSSNERGHKLNRFHCQVLLRAVAMMLSQWRASVTAPRFATAVSHSFVSVWDCSEFMFVFHIKFRILGLLGALVSCASIAISISAV